MKEIFKIKFKGKVRKIEKEKILYIISVLENQKISKTDENTLHKLITKHKLHDENFFDNVNKIWT